MQNFPATREFASTPSSTSRPRHSAAYEGCDTRRQFAKRSRSGDNAGQVGLTEKVLRWQRRRSIICPALVLNADFRPLSYYPLSLWCWQDAVKAVFLDRVNIVDQYDRCVRSPSFEMRLPSVIALKEYIQAGAPPGLHPVQRVPARPLHLPVLRRPIRAGSDLRPRRSALARRQDRWDNVVTACGSLQPDEGRPAAATRRDVPGAEARSSRRARCCRKTAAPSRPTICTKAGATISTGIPNSTRRRSRGVRPGSALRRKRA